MIGQFGVSVAPAPLLPPQHLVRQQGRPPLGVEVGFQAGGVVGFGLDPVEIAEAGRFAVAQVIFVPHLFLKLSTAPTRVGAHGQVGGNEHANL